MRIALTLIAVALVAALSAALLAPIFIDWNSQRTRIEAALGEHLGARVVVSGPIEARLLPIPYVILRKVAVGDGAPAFSAQSVRLEFALAGLASGQLRLADATIESPAVVLTQGSQTALPTLRSRFGALVDRVSLDRLRVTHGRLTATASAGAPLQIDDVDFEASAASLVGPFRGSGEFSVPGGGRARFQFVSSEIASAAMPIKGDIEGPAGSTRAAFDGKLAWADGAPAYAGALVLDGVAPALGAGRPTPWRLSGALKADSQRAAIDGLAFRLGPDERAVEATGTARLDWGAHPTLIADLKSKQLNLDSLLRREGEDASPPGRAVAAARRLWAAFGASGAPPFALQIAFASPTAILGAENLDDVSLTITANPDQPIAANFALGLPGQSRLEFVGAVDTGAAAGVRGHASAKTADFRALRDWATMDEPELAQRLASLTEAFPYATVSASGDIDGSLVAFSARGLKLVVDRSTLTGAVTYTQSLGGERGRLFADLHSDALDIDAAPNFAASSNLVGDLDLSLALDAAKLRIARVGQTTLDSGSLSLKATKTGADFSLDRLQVVDLGGATIDAQGQTSPSGKWAKVHIDAVRLRDFASLLARVAPGRYSRLLVERADALSPAKASFEARRDGAPVEADFPLDMLKGDGDAGPSRFTFKLSRASDAAGLLAADLSLDSSDAAALLRQLGLKAPAPPAGRAHMTASASGRWERGFDAQLAASAAGADLTWRGRLIPSPATPGDSPLFGTATLKTDNLTPLLTLFGYATGGGPAAPANLTADLVVRGADVSLPRIGGAVAGAKVAGNLIWRAPVVSDVASLDPDVAVAQAIAGEAPAATPAQISGQLTLDRATSSGLLAMGLGPIAPAKPGQRWSDSKFASPVLKPPPLAIKIGVGVLDLMDGVQARNFSAGLQMDANRFELDDIGLDVAGAHGAGQMVFRRDGAVAALTGRLDIDSLPFERSALRGRVGAVFDFASTGQSPSALINGLVGEGHVRLTGATIARLDPGALGRVVAREEAPDALIDETNVAHALSVELDRQPLALPDGATPMTLSGGVMRIGPLATSSATGHAATAGDFDLRSMSLSLHTTFAENRAGKFWTGSPPSFAVSFAPGPEASGRQLDVAGLSAGLAAQAIARESDRIAALESDLRERAFFNRRLKAGRFMARREAEIAAYEDDQRRIRSEEDRKRVEEELLKAEQLKAPAPDAPPVPDPAPTPASAAEVAPLVVEPKPRDDSVDPAASGIY